MLFRLFSLVLSNKSLFRNASWFEKATRSFKPDTEQMSKSVRYITKILICFLSYPRMIKLSTVDVDICVCRWRWCTHCCRCLVRMTRMTWVRRCWQCPVHRTAASPCGSPVLIPSSRVNPAWPSLVGGHSKRWGVNGHTTSTRVNSAWPSFVGRH